MKPMMTLQTAVQWLPGATLVGEGATSVQRVHTDTRSVEPGDLFLALKGEKFDANSMLHQAAAQGATALICHAGMPADSYPAGIPRIEVPDTHTALSQLAAGWRAQFSIPVIAVTGSNGKTTVTQMIASILQAAAGDDALATRGNLNNDIGVPLTLLRLRPHHRIAVVELGMNHPGEIEALAAIAQPTVALVNNAQREHLEFMATVQAVAQENGTVLDALPADGVAVFPADDAFSALWQARAGARRTLRFAADEHVPADVLANRASWSGDAWQVAAATPAGALDFQLHIAGAHNVKNALAAAACALAAGVPLDAIAAGLCAFEPVKGRSRALLLQHRGRRLTVVDDSYNANPDSVRAAIDVLAELPGPRLLVLGDMGEVGDQGPQFHAEAGQYARQRKIENMLCMGELSVHAAAAFGAPAHRDGIEAMNADVLAALPEVASVLVKGSRFMMMERVLQAIEAACEPVGTGATPC